MLQLSLFEVVNSSFVGRRAPDSKKNDHQPAVPWQLLGIGTVWHLPHSPQTPQLGDFTKGEGCYDLLLVSRASQAKGERQLRTKPRFLWA